MRELNSANANSKKQARKNNFKVFLRTI